MEADIRCYNFVGCTTPHIITPDSPLDTPFVIKAENKIFAPETTWEGQNRHLWYAPYAADDQGFLNLMRLIQLRIRIYSVGIMKTSMGDIGAQLLPFLCSNRRQQFEVTQSGCSSREANIIIQHFYILHY